MCFQKFAQWCAEKAGTWWAFLISLLVFVVWLATGHFYEWSDGHHRWFDVIISVTPFIMVFLLQATQNRDSDIVEAKLDDLLRAVKGTQDSLIGIQNHPEEKVQDNTH